MSNPLRVILCFGLAIGSQLSARAEVHGWPEFRGPTQNGQVPAKWKLPVSWSEDSGENIAWKTAIHGKAWSTPAVMEGRAWVTTATEDGKVMSALCLDAATGEILHDKILFENETPEPLGNPVNSYGSPSPTIEPGRVYIHFGSYGTACLDSKTAEVIWQRRDLPCRHYRGPASSVILNGGHLILTMDGVDVQYLTALDKSTGKTIWKTDRSTDFKDLDESGKPRAEGDYRKAYTTPLLASIGSEKQLISIGARATFGYNANTGEELWTVTYNGFSNAASPVLAHGKVFINTGYGKANLLVVPLSGESRGDLTSTVEWTATRRVPQRSSPIIAGEHLFMVTDEGILSCWRASDGERLWSERLKGSFSGSPIHHDGRLYFCSEEGDSYVVAAKDAFTLLHTNRLGEGMLASPAATDGAIYLRTKGHLYKIAAD